MSDQAYADSFKSNMLAFRDSTIKVTNQPFPPMRGLTREQKRKELAHQLREDARVWQESADRFRKIQPPPKLMGVNRLSVTLFQEMADDQVHWADLMIENSPESKRYADVCNAHMDASYRRLTDEIRRIVGPEAAHLEGSMKALEEMAQSR